MKTENIVTSDLSEFGYRELKQLEFLLKAMRENGLPNDFSNDEVVPMFNKNSGCVFLTNSEYQVAMESEGRLYSFYNCPQCGHEGNIDEIKDHSDHPDCISWVKDIQEKQ